MELVYLASPYTHPEARVRDNIGLKLDREVDHSFWMVQDIAILRKCDRLMVLTLDGWDTSKGVTEEIQLAHRLHMPVTYVKLEHL
jgi:hypothetical protein